MAMNRRKWVLVVCGVAVLAAVPLVVKLVRGQQDDAAYQEQLRLARAEGLPTSAAEFAALIPPAVSSENAGLLYRQLSEMGDRQETRAVDEALLFEPSPAALEAAKRRLAMFKTPLELIDRAVLLPRCWFDRRWQGVATLHPEYAEMKDAARLVALRGTVAAHEGRPADAIEDAKRIFRVAQHVREEPVQVAALVGESIEDIGVRNLASWALVHRDRREYGRALREAVEKLPRPNLKHEHLGDLYEVLSIIELCSTPEGLKELGLHENDIPKAAERFFPLFVSQSRSRVTIVNSSRAAWTTLDRPTAERRSVRAAALQELGKAFLAFPTAASIYGRLTSGMDDPGGRIETWEAVQQRYKALARALEGPTIPRTLDTSDLLSPFDGKPLTYAFDGKRITITVSRDVASGGPMTLQLPSGP